MEKVTKSLAIRFPESLHRDIKLQAYREGKTIQNWVFDVLAKKISCGKNSPAWYCQHCGGWTLKGTQMAAIGKCAACAKDEIAVFPIWEVKGPQI